MSIAKGPANRIRLGLAIALLAALTGCVGGYVDDGYGYGGYGYGMGPDMYVFGGGYDRGGDARNYGHRGFESRGVAHGGFGGGGGARGGGGAHGGGGGRR